MLQEMREVNLEIGRPSVTQGLDRLRAELRLSKKRGYAAVKLIHGFGSSGTGGKLRVAVRKELLAMQNRGEIGLVIPGERLTIFEEDTRTLLRLCPDAQKDPDLERHNNGITVVIIKKKR